MSVSDDACKKVFAKLTTKKKDSGKASAKPKGVKNVAGEVATSMGLEEDGSDVFDAMVVNDAIGEEEESDQR
jgi:hypothetical protein